MRFSRGRVVGNAWAVKGHKKRTPYYLTLNRTEFAYGWPDTTGGGAVTSEWIHPLVLPQHSPPSLPPSYRRVAHFLSLGAIFLFASPLVGPLSNKEQIISLLFARYRTLALPDFLFWIRFTRPSVQALYPSFPPPLPPLLLSSTCRCVFRRRSISWRPSKPYPLWRFRSSRYLLPSFISYFLIYFRLSRSNIHIILRIDMHIIDMHNVLSNFIFIFV